MAGACCSPDCAAGRHQEVLHSICNDVGITKISFRSLLMSGSVESGALLCSVAILYLVLTYTEKNSTVSLFKQSKETPSDRHTEDNVRCNIATSRAFHLMSLFNPLISRCAQGIAPTIIAVRVGLGRSVESVESSMTRTSSPLEFNPTSRQSIEQYVVNLRIDGDNNHVKAEVV